MHSNAEFYLKICIFFHISDHFLIANSKHQNVQIHQQTSTMLMIQTTKNRLVPILVGQAVLQTIGMSDYSLLHNITQTILLMPLLKELFLLLNQFITNNLCKRSDSLTQKSVEISPVVSYIICGGGVFP